MLSAKQPECAPLIALDASRGWAAQQARSVLARSLRFGDRRRIWRQALAESSLVRPITLNLARYLSACVPASDANAPLFDECLDSALQSWRLARSQAREKGCLEAYLQGLLHPLPTALEWTLSMGVETGRAFWNPLETTVLGWWRASGGLPEAHRRARPHDATYVEVAPADYRLIVLLRFLVRAPVRLGPFAGRLDEIVSRYG